MKIRKTTIDAFARESSAADEGSSAALLHAEFARCGVAAGHNVVLSSAYDFNGNRTSLAANIGGSMNTDGTASDGTPDFINSCDGQNVVLILNAAGQVTQRNLYAPAVDQILATEVVAPVTSGTQAAGCVDWLLADNQGTVRDVLHYNSCSSTTTVIDHLVYDAFGNVTSQTNSAHQPFVTYAGMQLDPATGLYYDDMRWYDAKNSVFISQDPIGFNDGQTNLQEYCGNSPTNYTDPSGMAEAVHDGPVTAGGISSTLGSEPILRGLGFGGEQNAHPAPPPVGLLVPTTCFPAGTLVAARDGLLPIEEIAAGGRVWAFDLVASRWTLSCVTNTFVNHFEGETVTLTVADESITSTRSHPYWVVSGNQLENRPRSHHTENRPEGATTPGRWVDAEHLFEGDELLLRDGRIGTIERRPFAGKVYNFSVAGLKCYAVGRNNVLVHNKALAQVPVRAVPPPIAPPPKGGWPGGWFNPGNWRRGLYTGDPNASDQMLETSVVYSGNYLYQHSPIRGGFALGGYTQHEPILGLQAGKTKVNEIALFGGWTIDDGFEASVLFAQEGGNENGGFGWGGGVGPEFSTGGPPSTLVYVDGRLGPYGAGYYTSVGGDNEGIYGFGSSDLPWFSSSGNVSYGMGVASSSSRRGNYLNWNYWMGNLPVTGQ